MAPGDANRVWFRELVEMLRREGFVTHFGTRRPGCEPDSMSS